MPELKTTNPEEYKTLNEGQFTVQKKDNMHIEQMPMKCTKICFGVTHGGGMTECQRSTWILSHSGWSQLTSPISLLTNVSRVSSDQSTDLSDARMTTNFVKTTTNLVFVQVR